MVITVSFRASEESPPKISGGGSAYGWQSNSPHWGGEEAWIKTFDLNYGIPDSQYDQVFGGHDATVKQRTYDLSQRQFDWVAGNSKYMDKIANPTGQFYSVFQNHIHLASPTQTGSGGLWTYLLNTFGGENVAFENLFLHSPTDKPYCNGEIKGWDPRRDLDGDNIVDVEVIDPNRTADTKAQSRYIPEWACAEHNYGLSFFDNLMNDTVYNYWDSVVTTALNNRRNNGPGQPADAYRGDGLFLDSGIDDIEKASQGQPYNYGVPDDALEAAGQATQDNNSRYVNWLINFQSFLGLVKGSLNANGFRLVNNSAGWRGNLADGSAENIYAQSLDGVLGEHELSPLEYYNNTFPNDSDTTLNEVRKQRIYKTKYNGQYLTQAHFYDTADLFASASGAPACNTPEHYQWYQMSGLANYYLTKQAATETYFRNSGNGCGLAATYGAPVSSFIYSPGNGVGRLPLGAIAYNIGQPDSPDFSILGSITARTLNQNSGLAENKTSPIFSRSYTASDGRKSLVVARIAPIGLRNYDQSDSGGPNFLEQAKPYFTNQSLYNIAGVLQAPLDLPEPMCLLLYNGGLRCGFNSKVSLRNADAAEFVYSPIKGSLALSDPDYSTSASDWINSANITSKKTLVDFDGFNNPDEVFQPTITTRQATVQIQKDLTSGFAKVEFLNKLDLNPASVYDFDVNATFDDNTIGIDTAAMPAFDKAARLTIKSSRIASIQNPVIERNGQTCPETICTLESRTGDTIVFRVTGFSNYDVVESSDDGGRGGDDNDGGNSTPTPPPNPETPTPGVTNTPQPGKTKTPGSGGKSGGNANDGGSTGLDDTGTGLANLLPSLSPTPGSDGNLELPGSEVASQRFNIKWLWGGLAGLALILTLIGLTLVFRRSVRRTLRQKRDQHLERITSNAKPKIEKK